MLSVGLKRQLHAVRALYLDCYELKIPEGERFAANSWFQNQAGPAFLQVDDATIFT